MVRIMYKKGPTLAEPNGTWQSSCFCLREMSRAHYSALARIKLTKIYAYNVICIWKKESMCQAGHVHALKTNNMETVVLQV